MIFLSKKSKKLLRLQISLKLEQTIEDKSVCKNEKYCNHLLFVWC